MDEQNKILEKSELVPGVILIKELKQYENENEYNSDSEILGIFLYRIQLTKMNVLNLEIDFSQSKNIKLKNTNNYKKIKVTIMPFETKTIAEILLLNNFKINPKFNFNLFVPEKKVQFKYIQKYEE
jgi:predicted RNA-binding protein